ncbi:MAG: hypothetical protein KJ914_12620 [Gammaproteobacteria bacterium]|nr:hypothetical protein [Gammaproteobacteria bacterium]MBU1725978.1 hypothetical protein [Gammaproteobacteria bacterium]MBU2004975.1 hypothetical protein [Gammaproteobacteria bacterium]
MKYLAQSVWMVMLSVAISVAAEAAQIVTPSQSSLSTGAEAFVFTPVYTISSPQTATLTGLGLRIHFNSSAVQFNGVTSPYAYGLQPVGTITADTEDFDADPLTDSYFVVGWVDLTARWPGTGMVPLNLLAASFQPQAGFTGITHIRTTATVTADAAAFQSTPMTVTLTGSPPAVQVRAFLQGSYVMLDGKMRDSLRESGVLPASQPYAGFGYNGSETASPALLAMTGNDAPVDWVLVELRDSTNPQTIVATHAALLQRDGDVASAADGATTLTFTGIAPGSYYLALRHRNHLGVMSAAPVVFSGAPVLVDFTAATTAVYGSTDIRLPAASVRMLPSGDANNDSKLIADGPENDKNTVLAVVMVDAGNSEINTNFQASGYKVTDLNMDGKTVFAGPGNDVNILLGNVLLHSANTTSSTNYIVRGSMP